MKCSKGVIWGNPFTNNCLCGFLLMLCSCFRVTGTAVDKLRGALASATSLSETAQTIIAKV